MYPQQPDVWGIDGDIIVYSVGFAAENDPLSFALKSVKSAVQNIVNDCGEEGIVYLTGKDNYRIHEADPLFPYKGNRKDTAKPRHIEGIREYMIETMDAIVAEGQEADDLLGIGAVQQGHGIATLDKDLNGIAGWHHNWKKRETYYVSEIEADRFFYKQLLTGDSTDNIPGLFKRVGRKATKKLLEPLDSIDNVQEMFFYVQEVYRECYDQVGMCLDERDEVVDKWLLGQARCLWIRRDHDQVWEMPTHG